MAAPSLYCGTGSLTISNLNDPKGILTSIDTTKLLTAIVDKFPSLDVTTITRMTIATTASLLTNKLTATLTMSDQSTSTLLSNIPSTYTSTVTAAGIFCRMVPGFVGDVFDLGTATMNISATAPSSELVTKLYCSVTRPTNVVGTLGNQTMVTSFNASGFVKYIMTDASPTPTSAPTKIQLSYTASTDTLTAKVLTANEECVILDKTGPGAMDYIRLRSLGLDIHSWWEAYIQDPSSTTDASDYVDLTCDFTPVSTSVKTLYASENGQTKKVFERTSS